MVNSAFPTLGQLSVYKSETMNGTDHRMPWSIIPKGLARLWKKSENINHLGGFRTDRSRSVAVSALVTMGRAGEAKLTTILPYSDQSRRSLAMFQTIFAFLDRPARAMTGSAQLGGDV
jgi:hypothetical protein